MSHSWRPMTKGKKSAWYGNPYIQNVKVGTHDIRLRRDNGNESNKGIITKEHAKELQEAYHETGRYARVTKVKGGYAVYVSGRDSHKRKTK